MKLIPLAGLLFFLVAATTASSQAVKKLKIEELTSYIRKSDHPLVVNFWATWCAPCIKELPYLEDAVKQHAGQQVELVLVSLDFKENYPKKIAGFVKQRNMSATFFWLDETNADHFSPQIDSSWSGGIPSTLLVNGKTGYRKFFERQLTESQAYAELNKLVSIPVKTE